MYRLFPLQGAPVTPDDAASRLRALFVRVSADATEADSVNASFLEKFQRLRAAGLGSIGPEAEQRVLDERSPGRSLLVRVWESTEEGAFVQMLVLPGVPAIDLQFSEAIPASNRSGFAKRLADALDCRVERLEDN